jgi:hypothetical protein
MMVQKTAGVHEKTVQRAEELAGEHVPKRRGRGRQINSSVQQIKVHPRVLEEAKRLAAGRDVRLRIVDANTVVIENRPPLG